MYGFVVLIPYINTGEMSPFATYLAAYPPFHKGISSFGLINGKEVSFSSVRLPFVVSNHPGTMRNFDFYF